MRFASVIHEGRPRLVRVEGEVAVPLAGATELGVTTSTEWLAAARADGDPIPVAELEYRPLVPAPAKVLCVGLNYAAHVAETQRETTDYPTLFCKFASSLTGPRTDVPLPPESTAIDYEGELAIVIGAAARRIPRERALEAVAGFTVANDISMRDYQNFTTQFTPGKAWDRCTPLGPELVTPDEAGDGSALALRTTVNGETVQESTTDLLIFDIPTLVSTVSVFTELVPGDVILTGTPSGVGFRREPPLLLGDGDLVTVEIDGIGRIENRMVSER